MADAVIEAKQGESFDEGPLTVAAEVASDDVAEEEETETEE
jgi:hypothetical protein